MSAESYASENTFEQGLQADMPVTNSPNTSYVEAHNLHLYSGEGDELCLKSEPGTIPGAWLRTGYVPLAVARYDGITYVYSAEIRNGVATGWAELGSFPAPIYEDGSEGDLQPQYRPLQNYFGDFDGAVPTDFRSELFEANLEDHVEMLAQPSYDGSVNLLLRDDRHPVRLINSGFSVRDNGQRFEIVARSGSSDTNQYRYRDFSSRLNLLQRSLSLPKVFLRGVSGGGQVLAGNWRYVFRYQDADGNQTDVCCESFLVSVLEGDSPATSRGVIGKTTRRVELELTGLDPTYGFVVVQAQHDSGEPEATISLYAFDLRISISVDGTARFTHTGFEQLEAISEQELSVRTPRIGSVRTMALHDGRLLLGGVRENGYDADALRAAAASMQLGHSYETMTLPGTDDSSAPGAIYTTPARTDVPAATWGEQLQKRFEGGYSNAHNIYNRLGYWGGESYAFGVVFVLQDGSLSDVFPLQGLDNVDGTRAQVADTDPDFYNDQGWVSSAFSTADNTGQNRAGVYRFPVRNADGAPALLSAGEQASILAGTIQLPVIPAALRAQTRGLFFVRAARVPNATAQGVLVPTVRSLVVPPAGNRYNRFDHVDGALSNIYNGSSVNLKVLPAVGGVIEATVKKDEADNKVGVFPFGFTRQANNNSSKQIYDPKRAAFYSPDLLLRPASQRSRVHGRNVNVQPLATGFIKRAVAHANDAGLGGSWSLTKTIRYQSVPYSTPGYTGQSWWTLAGSNLTNDGQFGSLETSLRGKHRNSDKYLIHASWNEYVGVVTNQNMNLSTTLVPNFFAEQTGVEIAGYYTSAIAEPAAAGLLLANLYPESTVSAAANQPAGIWATDVLPAIYQPEALEYAPITPRLSWEELESSLDSDRKLLVYGGDCYVGLFYRRLYTNVLPEQAWDKMYGDGKVGPVLSVCCESNVNPYARGEDIATADQVQRRSFLPLIGASSQNFSAFRENNPYRQPEPSSYNAGYLVSGGQNAYLALSANTPFLARDFFSRVWATAPAIPGSFINGIRQLLPLAFRDYSPELGPAVRLLSASGRVHLVQPSGVSIVPVNERVAITPEQGQPLVLHGADVLGPTPQVLSSQYGAESGRSVLATDNAVYGICQSGRVLWRTEGQGLRILNEMQVQQQLKPHWPAFDSYTPRWLTQQAYIAFDEGRQDVLFNFYRANALPANADSRQPQTLFQGPGNVQLIYSEKLNRWIGQADYRALMQFSAGTRLLSWPLPEVSAGRQPRLDIRFHAHRVSSFHNQVYGRPMPCSVSFIVRGNGSETQKILQNLLLVSSDAQPDSITYQTNPDLPARSESNTQRLISNGSILQRNASYKEDHWYVVVRRMGEGAKRGRIRGRTIRVTITYSSIVPVQLHRVISYLQQSFS